MSVDQILSVTQKLNSPVLIIGHTGFKGTWLTLLLERLGIELTGISLPADTSSMYSKLNRDGQIKEYFQDIRDAGALEKLIQKIKPKYIFHLAAQPLVLNSYKTTSARARARMRPMILAWRLISESRFWMRVSSARSLHHDGDGW